jgi:hypothetical protein
MYDEIFKLVVTFGGFAALFSGMAILSDYVLPALAEKFNWEIT